MTQPMMSNLFAVVVADDGVSLARCSGSFSTVLVEADDEEHARRRAREAGLLVTSCTVSRVSVYALRFYGGVQVLVASGEKSRMAHYVAGGEE